MKRLKDRKFTHQPQMTDPSRLTHLRIKTREALQPWGRRTLFVIGGLLVGAAAVLMAMLADRAQHEFHHLLSISRYISLGLTPLGFGFIVFLTVHVFPNSQGSGIPQVIAARELPEGPPAPLSSRYASQSEKSSSLRLDFSSGLQSGAKGQPFKSAPRSCMRWGAARWNISVDCCSLARRPALLPHSTRRWPA